MRKVLLQKYDEIDYALIYLPENQVTPFVAAWAPTYIEEKIDHWGQGHYFCKLENAVLYILDLQNAKKLGGIK